MKTCPNCHKELSDPVLECLCGHRFPQVEGAESADRFKLLRALRTAVIAVQMAGGIFAGQAWAATDTNAPPMGSTDYMDWKNGFRDVRFGEDLTKRSDMEPLFPSPAGTASEYKKKSETLEIGDVKLKSIIYFAHHGKLYEIEMESSWDNGSTVLDAFTAALRRSHRKDEQAWRADVSLAGRADLRERGVETEGRPVSFG